MTLLTDQTWHIYCVASADLKGWRSFGIRHEQIVRAEDMSAIAIALLLLRECLPKSDIVTATNEYWLTECPLHKHPFVCVRPGSNPYAEGYIISPIPLTHIAAESTWEKTL